VREKRQLERTRTALKKHRKKEPGEEATRGQLKRWERRETSLETQIGDLQANIKWRNSLRRQVQPVIKQLEGIEGVTTRLEKFRESFLAAHSKGKQVVLSFLPTFRNQWGGHTDFLTLLDKVATTKRFQSSEAVKFMKNAPLLLDTDAAAAIEKGRVGGWGSSVDQKQRRLNVDPREISASVRFVAAGVLPDKADPALSLLVDTILIHVSLPGVGDQKDLNHVVKTWSGKKNPKAADFLEYAFEHTAVLPKEDYYELLDALRSAGVQELPERCHTLAAERFRLPRHSLSDFELFNRRYQPQKLGHAPVIFDDLATFRGYTDLKLDAIGMSHEVKQIEQLLETEGMVCVVDGTAYHPELKTEVAATGETLDAGDEEDTNELWGKYVRPSERAVRAFGLRMMEGDLSDGLKHHSLMSVHRPDKEEKVMASVIKAFFGVDIDITPDLAQVNKVLSDLVMHDDKMILVLDAENVSDLDQYRDFLELLDRYNIKTILRSREPLPGLPQVNVQPFQSHEIAQRLLEEGPALARKLRLDTVPSKEILDFTAEHVRRNRGSPGDDPLNLTLQVLDGAASLVRARDDSTLYEQDIVQAANGIFHKPDGLQMQLKVEAIDSFAERAPMEVLGQEKAIGEIASKMKSHILGLRDPSRPLTILLPGPTGVGKTELMLKFAQACDLPFFMIEGAEFSEENTINRLIGSPSGYVGPDEGILFKHLKDNNVGLVFIDEIEKMHPSVYQALMNFFDKATLTSGKGEIVRRSGFTIDREKTRKQHYEFINYVSALAVDACFFNSNYHLESFTAALRPFLKQFPEPRNLHTIENIKEKCSVIPVGVTLPTPPALALEHSNPPCILWNHRWEYDKNPEDFFALLKRLKTDGVRFRLVVLGESFDTTPECFSQAEKEFSAEIDHFGFCKSKDDYWMHLSRADVLPVTSNQEFFGVSVVEAIHAGVYPLLPDRLAFPELIPSNLQGQHLYDGSNNHLYERLKEFLNAPKTIAKAIQEHIEDFAWPTVVVSYDEAFEKLIQSSCIFNHD
jgi:glycosyltransferase involved in cell wall biosynthesis